VIVVGGGVVGAALALALKREKFDVALIERGQGRRPSILKATTCGSTRSRLALLVS